MRSASPFECERCKDPNMTVGAETSSLMFFQAFGSRIEGISFKIHFSVRYAHTAARSAPAPSGIICAEEELETRRYDSSRAGSIMH